MDHGLLSRNTCISWYENQPFIVATMTRLVFYLDDPKEGGGWNVVNVMSHRGIYTATTLEMGIANRDIENVTLEPYQKASTSNIPDTETIRINNDIHFQPREYVPAALEKRKAQEEVEKRLRLECAQQYGSSYTESNTATPTAAPPGSLADSAPPLTDEDESTNQVVQTPSKALEASYEKKVAMKKESWYDLDKEERKKIFYGLTCFSIIDFNDIKAIKWINKRAASVFCERKHDLSEIHTLGGRDVIPEDLLHRRDEWEWLCTHFDSDKLSVANSSNRGKKELEHHSGRKPIIYRVAELRDKATSLPVVEVYPVIYDINQPKAAEHYVNIST
ncbi:hypothetical protein ACLB2K_056358 [Fragaria x ananassa]